MILLYDIYEGVQILSPANVKLLKTLNKRDPYGSLLAMVTQRSMPSLTITATIFVSQTPFNDI